jgi:diacylglycerol O-acyltransferase
MLPCRKVAMERMSTPDAGFFFVEHENVPMHLGSLALFEGPPPAYGDLVRLFAAKLPLVPRYRQVVRTTPLNIFRPAWADDEHFEIGYHLRHAAVPKPGGDDQLRNLAARIYAQRLDRARPLWEAWFLEGIEGGRWAILSKVHHCMVDGIGGTDLMTVMFDIGPDAERPAPASWEPDPGPSVLSLVSDGLADTLTWPLRQLTGVPGFFRQQLRAPGELAGFGRGLIGSARRLAAPAASSLNGSIGPHRRWAWTTAGLSEVKEIRGSLGGTVNDVLLAAITRGFRDLLQARGELAEGLVVRSLVPVSVRGQDERGLITNRVSAVLANLPVGEADPVCRLALLRGQMDDLKSTYQAVGRPDSHRNAGFRRADAAGAWLTRGLQPPAAARPDRDHERPWTALPAVHPRPPDGRGLPLRADREQCADIGGDLLLSGTVRLRHHRRLRRGGRPGCPGRRDRPGRGRARGPFGDGPAGDRGPASAPAPRQGPGQGPGQGQEQQEAGR